MNIECLYVRQAVRPAAVCKRCAAVREKGRLEPALACKSVRRYDDFAVELELVLCPARLCELPGPRDAVLLPLASVFELPAFEPKLLLPEVPPEPCWPELPDEPRDCDC
jgi:hypothetical protein